MRSFPSLTKLIFITDPIIFSESAGRQSRLIIISQLSLEISRKNNHIIILLSAVKKYSNKFGTAVKITTVPERMEQIFYLMKGSSITLLASEEFLSPIRS